MIGKETNTPNIADLEVVINTKNIVAIKKNIEPIFVKLNLLLLRKK